MKTNHHNTANNVIRCFSLAAIMITLFYSNVFAQRKLGVLNVYTNVTNYNSETMGNLVRMEIEKLDTFAVIDKFDMQYFITSKNINPNCNSKLCLLEIGKTIGADLMVYGTVESMGGKIYVTMKILDVKKEETLKSHSVEFLPISSEVGSMVNITLNELVDRKVDQNLRTKLTKQFDYDNAINNPHAEVLNATGPRTGVTMLTGKTAEYMSSPKSQGGFGIYPVLFTFGYQFEQQYLNEGNFQALFEFIPMVSGLDQGLCVPSFTFMNGLRNNRHGWEFAFGPQITVSKTASGWWSDGHWHLSQEWTDSLPNPNTIITRIDSRGTYHLATAFVFAAGKTFKSGNMNIPVNVYFIPSCNGFRVGASFGYNSRKR
ncbi:MAG: hypothetical protein V2A54_07530 [Bacteroidota bacterium]